MRLPVPAFAGHVLNVRRAAHGRRLVIPIAPKDSFSVGYQRRISNTLRTIDRGSGIRNVSAMQKQSMEALVMPDVVYPLIYWPIGVALGSWLFFEIARRM